eukprot:gnl/TRDRNA2_/TRDRNA2_85001_c0_seq2.p1 gnl/TRDRNA2_/TRDRNA2_85001_c0~~gnl/TRDRNA2_/TRDRNA2_85001_c0_seq2.p1  ORF type:complete len:292 (+),score=31.38 gnl/TRDRNA2_/TRDRNA2_85001_c0_seq2:37-876(+)
MAASPASISDGRRASTDAVGTGGAGGRRASGAESTSLGLSMAESALGSSIGGGSAYGLSPLCPCVDIRFEIDLPSQGSGSAEASPMFDDVPAHTVDKVRQELLNPHSVLRLRLKERLEKAIAAQAMVVCAPRDEVTLKEGPPKRKEHTVTGILGLRSVPKDTGGSYMFRGPTPAEAPFFGHKYTHTGTTEVSMNPADRPAFYQPYRAPHEQPPQADRPATAATPSGKRPNIVQQSDELRKAIALRDQGFVAAEQPDGQRLLGTPWNEQEDQVFSTFRPQ